MVPDTMEYRLTLRTDRINRKSNALDHKPEVAVTFFIFYTTARSAIDFHSRLMFNYIDNRHKHGFGT